MPARGFSSGEDSGILATAQAALNTNNPNEAMKAYTSLIRKNLLLNEVIRDLREATNRFPMDIKVWMTLGEASMRANHLQDALDAYTKAEDLLQ
jgi:Flp pilus assembly protein TadD